VRIRCRRIQWGRIQCRRIRWGDDVSEEYSVEEKTLVSAHTDQMITYDSQSDICENTPEDKKTRTRWW